MPKPKIYFSGRRKNRPHLKRDVFVGVISQISRENKKVFEALQYVFLNDEELLNINIQYLNHNTFTDIITFDLTEGAGIIGEIYVSLDRIIENASIFNVSLKEEFLRVLFHGALHLLGYKDKSAKDKQAMREAETYCINLYLEKEA
jgi:probable rRNA maturation factor